MFCWVRDANLRSADGLLGEPGEDLLGVPAGREDRIEHVLDDAVTQDEGLAPVERHAAGGEGGQAELVGEEESWVGEHGERSRRRSTSSVW